MSTYKGNIKAIDKLILSLDHRLSYEQCHKYFERVFKEYDSKWSNDLYRNHWKKSDGRIILQVHERLNTCAALIEDFENNLDSIRRFKYPAIVLYLKLAYFDKLGQPGKYMPFNNWIKSKKTKEERTTILSEINGLSIEEKGPSSNAGGMEQ